MEMEAIQNLYIDTTSRDAIPENQHPAIPDTGGNNNSPPPPKGYTNDNLQHNDKTCIYIDYYLNVQ
jgi:hypothetical protein